MPFKDPLKRRQARRKSEAARKVADDAAAAERNLAVIKRTLSERDLHAIEGSEVLREFVRGDGRFGSELVRLNMARSILTEHGVTSADEARRLLLRGKLAELRFLAHLADDAKDTDRSVYGESLDAIIGSGREVGPLIDVAEMAVENLEMGEREYERERERDARRHGSPWNVYQAGEPTEADIAQTHTSWWPRYRDQFSESYPDRPLAGWRWIRRNPSIVCDCCTALTWDRLQFEPWEDAAALIALDKSMYAPLVLGQEFRIQDRRLTFGIRLWSAEEVTLIEPGWRPVQKTRGRGKKLTELKPGPTSRSEPFLKWAHRRNAGWPSRVNLFSYREPIRDRIEPWLVFATRKTTWSEENIAARAWFRRPEDQRVSIPLSDASYHIFGETYTWSQWLEVCAKHDEDETARKQEERFVEEWQNAVWTGAYGELDQLDVDLFHQGDIVIGSRPGPEGRPIFDDFTVGDQWGEKLEGDTMKRGDPEPVLVPDDDGHWVRRYRRPIIFIRKARRSRPYFMPVRGKYQLAFTVAYFHVEAWTQRETHPRHHIEPRYNEPFLFVSLLRALACNLYVPPQSNGLKLEGTRHMTRYAEMVEGERNR